MIANKLRIVLILSVIVSMCVGWILANYYLEYIWIMFVTTPLLILGNFVYSATQICPRCKNNMMSPSLGESEMNPYYNMYLLGKCCNCNEKI
jgi:hypothetical protein